MRHFMVFVAGVLLIGNTAGDEAAPQTVPPAVLQDVCSDFGNDFCKRPATCHASTDVKETFTCKCDRDDMYYDAIKEMCQYKKTCETVECSVGRCREPSINRAKCSCEDLESLTLHCNVKDYFIKHCEEKDATAVVDPQAYGGARCRCEEWTVMDSGRSKCVPTTCWYPSLSCKDLCEKKLLDKDQNCCEGWDQNDCSKAPEDGTYCSPGTIRKDGSCQSVCQTGEAKLLCTNGCKRSQVPGRAFECRCNSGYVVAEDGIQCKVDYKRLDCTQEDQQKCLPGQNCIMRNKTAVCQCPYNQHLLNGKCTDECSENDCHERFTDCDVYSGKQRCSCPWTNRKNRHSSATKECTLNEYYYTVSFKPNISLDAYNCDAHRARVLQAMRTTIGPEVFMVEILSCADDFKTRLITNNPLSPYLLKKLQICEHAEGDACIIYPKLPIQKGSATEIVEEDLCDSMLKPQADATKDTNDCVRDGNYFWFKCRPGFREVDLKTRGRLRRSVCKPGVSCDVGDEQECHKTGHICTLEGQQAVCKCPLGKIEDQGKCKATCTQEKQDECKKNGEECVIDKDEAVCRNKEDSTATTEFPQVPATCTEERQEQCEKKGEECIVENGQAVCKTKGDSATATAPPVPGTCTEEMKEQCEEKGEECMVENGQAVCKTKGDSTTATAPPVPATCTEERKAQCEKKGEECIVENAQAVCKAKVDSATTTAPPGSGSRIVPVSAVLLLAIFIPALYT